MTTMTKRLLLIGMSLVLLAPLGYTGVRSLMGYGECYKCNCKKFEGAYSTCNNCGHNYQSHY